MDKIGVVVVTYNHSRYLDGCLGSLERQSYRNFVTVVVDNGSTDGTLEKLRGYNVHVIESGSNFGFAHACNVGARWAVSEYGCDYVLLLNPDTESGPRMLEEMLSSAKAAGEMAVVQGKVFLMSDRRRLNTAGDKLHYLYFGYCGDFGETDSYPEDRDIGLASGACLMLGCGLLERLGYLFVDEFFMYHEDTDLSARVRLIGGRLVLCARATVWHDYRFKSGGRKFFHMEKNRLFLLLQNYRAATLLLLAPAIVFTELQVILHSVLEGWFGWKLRSYLWLLGHLPLVLENRHRVQASRKLGDLEMMADFVTGISFEAVDNPGLRYVTNPLLKVYYRMVVRLLGFISAR